MTRVCARMAGDGCVDASCQDLARPVEPAYPRAMNWTLHPLERAADLPHWCQPKGLVVMLATAVHVRDPVFFALVFALKTHFPKIADPFDIAPTASVAFTFNHIVAVVLSATLGLPRSMAPGAVFALAVCLAAVSAILALMVPRHPAPGHETVFTDAALSPAE